MQPSDAIWIMQLGGLVIAALLVAVVLALVLRARARSKPSNRRHGSLRSGRPPEG